MPFGVERQLIESYVQDNWTTTSIKYDNVAFKQPKNDPFVSLSILSGAGTSAAIGVGSLQRYVGIIQLDIYVPEDTGTKTARDIATELRTLFNDQELEDGEILLRTRTPSLNRVAKGPEGKYRVTVTVPYNMDVN